MCIDKKISWLKMQIVALTNLLQLSEGDPIAAPQLYKRIELVKEELQALESREKG